MHSTFLSVALAAGFGLAVCGPVLAQDGSYKVSAASERVEVQAGHAITLDFDQPFAELSIGDPDTADISSLSETQIYLLGKTIGSTTLTVLRDRTPMDVGHLTVMVYRDIAPMQRFLEKAAGDVALSRDGEVVMALGCVADAGQQAAMDSVLAQLSGWGYTTLADVGLC